VGHIQGTNRHEERLFPERLDDSMAAEHPVRCIDAFVDALDLATLGFQRVQAAATGRPASHPGDLLQLSLSGSLSRLRSSRRLEQETHRTVEWMWLLKKLHPDHKTMAQCRRDHLHAMRQVCRACTLLCQQLARLSGELSALDGSKGKAVHAQERTVTQSQRQRLLPPSEAQSEVYRKALEHGDSEEEHGPCGGARAEPLQAKMAERKERQLLDQAFQEPLRASGQAPRSLTDPDSRAMQRGTGRGTEVC
jgi:transposase